jgi:hypothetical protein
MDTPARKFPNIEVAGITLRRLWDERYLLQENAQGATTTLPSGFHP